MYKLAFGPAAFRVFKKLPKNIQNIINQKANFIKADPLIGEPLKGIHRQLRSFHFSYKGTAYRIIYQIFEKSETIIIRLADKRENIYKRLEHMKL